jgi:hypothetical protein
MRSLLWLTVLAAAIFAVLAGETPAQARHPRACHGGFSPGSYSVVYPAVYYAVDAPDGRTASYASAYPGSGDGSGASTSYYGPQAVLRTDSRTESVGVRTSAPVSRNVIPWWRVAEFDDGRDVDRWTPDPSDPFYHSGQ